MRPNGARNAPSGFTLVELLVVLAISGLIVSVSMMTLHSAGLSWSNTDRFNARSEDIEAINSLLRRTISQTYPERTKNSPDSAIRFVGEAQRMYFLCPLPARFGARDMAVCSLRFTEDGKMHLNWRLDRPENDFSNTAPDEAIDGFADASLSYWRSEGASESQDWQSSWKDEKALPKLLRLRYLFRGRREEIVIAPRITNTVCFAGSSETSCP